MDRIELGKALNLNEELIAKGRDNRPGTRINPTSVTLHNTDNDDRGANADRHSRFVRETGFYLLNGAMRQVGAGCEAADQERLLRPDDLQVRPVLIAGTVDADLSAALMLRFRRGMASPGRTTHSRP